ncbi:MAG: hypothetical protein CMC15_18635 [Flavobacteriaceae bacterium]|nr:hypothetical protein [Flavobacteriaceae bacterium]|tara:strand:- start:436 stop:666 length:231 start_codon:yes stop_codon:yes gene_type:complete
MSSKTYSTEKILSDGSVLIFTTTGKETICTCDAKDYMKLVYRHDNKKKKASLKTLHESVKHLFAQYVLDAENQPNV